MSISDPVRHATATDITTTELHDRLGRDAAAVVDVRPTAAYNGWRLQGEARGGHLPGAVALPGSWLTRLDDGELRGLLQDKGITPAREVILYGHGPDDPEGLRGRLESLGHRPRVYRAGLAEWASDDGLPLERLARYDRLVHPAWLRDLIDGRRPEAFDGDRFVVLHVNFGVPEEYAEGHLPGAFYLDTNRLEDPADWNRRSAAEIEATLMALGIDRTTTVVLYGRDTIGHANEKWPGRRAGQIAATRAALILRYAGVDDVRVLDGGYDRWVEAGQPVETQPNVPTAVGRFGAAIPQRPELIVDLAGAKAILADEQGALVSVRTWREHIGAVSGYNYIGPAGRIAGDVWGNCGSDAYHMQHYRNVDNTMRAYPEIAANWAAAGITPDKRVAFYCGTGWRASETWFYADLMAWPRIAVYDGGWYEWSRDPANNPIEVGEPREEAAA